jgi:hypothetical protein
LDKSLHGCNIDNFEVIKSKFASRLVAIFGQLVKYGKHGDVGLQSQLSV